jgi:hypothetical protein
MGVRSASRTKSEALAGRDAGKARRQSVAIERQGHKPHHKPHITWPAVPSVALGQLELFQNRSIHHSPNSTLQNSSRSLHLKHQPPPQTPLLERKSRSQSRYVRTSSLSSSPRPPRPPTSTRHSAARLYSAIAIAAHPKQLDSIERRIPDVGIAPLVPHGRQRCGYPFVIIPFHRPASHLPLPQRRRTTFPAACRYRNCHAARAVAINTSILYFPTQATPRRRASRHRSPVQSRRPANPRPKSCTSSATFPLSNKPPKQLE